jgi:hypothetical protein
MLPPAIQQAPGRSFVISSLIAAKAHHHNDNECDPIAQPFIASLRS